MSRGRKAVALFLVGLPMWVGCGETVETVPAVEPNVGPGVAAGGGTGKGDTKPPSFGPAGKAEKTAPPAKAEKAAHEKSVEKK